MKHLEQHLTRILLVSLGMGLMFAGPGACEKKVARTDDGAETDSTDTSSSADADTDGDTDVDGDTDADSDGDGDADGDGDSDSDDAVTIGGIPVDPDSIMGPDSGKPYTPDETNSEAVDINEDGWLTLTGDLSAARSDLWVANSGDGTVSRIDTREIREIGRYHVGNSGASSPSRTTVDLAGDMFVGNRGLGSVTKIAADTERCMDRNTNGTIETSTGPTDILPRAAAGDPNGVLEGESTDECVLWTRTLANCSGPRAMAATAETGEDFEFNGHVWVGCRDSSYIYKLNGSTGEVLEEFAVNGLNGAVHIDPYGFVLDNKEHLWIASAWGDQAEHKVFVLDIPTATFHDLGGHLTGGPAPYGIAIDHNGHIWVATFTNGGGFIWRYTPGPGGLDGGLWESLKTNTDILRGIAVDETGIVYAIESTGAKADIHMIHTPALFPDPSSYVELPLDGANGATEGSGVALDFDGHLWGVGRRGCTGGAGCAFRFEIDRTNPQMLHIADTTDVVDVGGDAYSYSDLTGYSMRNFATNEGWYRQNFRVCENQSTAWQQIGFESSIPGGTRVIIRARTANFEEDLDAAEFVTVVESPPDATPVTLPSELPEGRFIQLEVHLYRDEPVDPPAVGNIGFTYECTETIDIE